MNNFQHQQIQINSEYETLVPQMSKESFESLLSSIRANGQLEPITVNGKGIVLDGHHRLRACQQLKIEPRFKVKNFENPLSEKLFIIDINLQRRQLTIAQRVELSLRKKPIYEELAKLNQSLAGKAYGWGKTWTKNSSVQICTELDKLSPMGRVNEVIAKDSGVSARQVSKIEAILKSAGEELKVRVLDGRTSVDKAFRKIKKQERRQELIEEAANNIRVDLPTGCKLIYGDFIEQSKNIADNSIDFIFTDPPYSMEYLYLYGELAKVAQRVLKPGGSLLTILGHYAMFQVNDLIMGNSTNLKFYWQFIILHTGQTKAQHGPKVYAEYKPLFWYAKGDRSNAPNEYIEDVICSKPPDKTGNDWEQSPVEAAHCISKLTVENQLVFDPMMGYATTGIAALKLNRKFIGIEIDEENFKTARLRIQKEL